MNSMMVKELLEELIKLPKRLSMTGRQMRKRTRLPHSPSRGLRFALLRSPGLPASPQSLGTGWPAAASVLPTTSSLSHTSVRTSALLL